MHTSIDTCTDTCAYIDIHISCRAYTHRHIHTNRHTHTYKSTQKHIHMQRAQPASRFFFPIRHRPAVAAADSRMTPPPKHESQHTHIAGTDRGPDIVPVHHEISLSLETYSAMRATNSLNLGTFEKKRKLVVPEVSSEIGRDER